MKNILSILILIFGVSLMAQRPQQSEWTASWITLDKENAASAGQYLFRESIALEAVPETFNIRISADNRYKLFVNESLVSTGPNWGDIKHYNYLKLDLAPYLKSGQNSIAVQVWNEAELRPVAQFSYKTALIIQGMEASSQVINTDESWKVLKDTSYTPKKQQVDGYYAAGAGDFIDFNKGVFGWKAIDFDDTTWETAEKVFEATAQGFGFRQQAGWQLVPSILPDMELKKERLQSLRRAEGVQVPKTFPQELTAITIPANTKATLLLDQEHLTNAYLTLLFSKGKNSGITLTYAESLFDANGVKGNRNRVEEKEIKGRRDSIISGGQMNQEFTTLTYRTYRYLQLAIETQDEPLVVEDIYGTFKGYPFELNAQLDTKDEELEKMMEIGWRTARLCAVDTYMDCPYYERLQYVGDTRIQHFVSFYNSGDDRLIKNAINLLDYSRQPNGYTLSRYPDRQDQVIPTYALWYVSILYDYMMYGTDTDFITEKLMGSRQVLNYFITYLDKDGSLKNVPGWNYTDWVPEWNFGVAPMAEDGSSALLDLQMLLALQSGIALEKELGKPEFVTLYETLAAQLKTTIKSKYWDEASGLFADTPDKQKYSQHANSLAILADIVDDPTKQAIGAKLLSNEDLAPASIYFKYYLHLALNAAGYGDDYLDWLDIWRKNIDLGLTTWGETSQVETTRSDCHAWGASPNIEFFRIILGIESAAPNFEKVKIEPHIEDFETIGGEMPHPAGMIKVAYDQKGSKLKATITLPKGITGTFVWDGKVQDLSSGENTLSL